MAAPGAALPLAAVMLAVGILLGRAGTALWPALAAMAAAAAGIWLSRGRIRTVCCLIGVAVLGSVVGWIAYHPAVPEEGMYVVSGVVSDEAVLAERRVPTRLTDVTLNGVPAPSDAYWSFYADELPEGLAPGIQVTFTGRVYEPSGADNPYGFDFREYLLAEGIVFAVYGADDLTVSPPEHFSPVGQAAAIRHVMINSLVDVLGEEAGGYAAAMLLGSKTLIPQEELEAFSETGAAHILAVSGFHVGVLAMLVRFLLKRQSLRLGSALLAVALAAYCLMTGGNPPVIRAMLLVMLASCGKLLHRQVNALWTLSAAFIIMLMINPAQLTGASFQLSFAAVLGIVTVEPFLRRLWNPKQRIVSAVWSAMRVSLGAQLGVLLPQLYWYHEFPLAALLLNLVLIPYASVLISLLWAVMIMLPVQPLCALPAVPARWMTELMLQSIRALDATGVGGVWTGASNLVTFIGWLMILFACSTAMSKTGRKRAAVLLSGTVILIVSLIPLPHAGTEYIQLAAGAADAAVLHDGDTVTVIDAGENAILANYLHAKRLSVDTLIISHLHGDHAGGIEVLLEEGIPVAVCCLPFGAADAQIDSGTHDLIRRLAQTGTEIRILSRGDTLPLPNGRIDVLWPENGRVRPGRDANISPLVTRIEVRGVSILSMGDLYGTYEHYCAVPADILKAAHHGDEKGTFTPFLEAVSPRVVIIPSGSGTFDPDTVERTSALPVYTTHEYGAVTVVIDDGGFSIRTHK